MRTISIKSTLIIGFFSCVALLAIALYMQLVLELIPCILCVIQRFFILVLAFLFLIGLMFHKKLWIKIHALVLFMVSFLGGVVAARQVWLQYFSSEPHTACAPSLTYMLDHLPLNEVLKRVVQGNGDCGVIEWSWLNLSIPVWVLIFFVLVCVLAIMNYRRA